MTRKTPTRRLFGPPNNQAGFTLADVAIASAIFAGVLIVCLSAFMAMGRIYFKGSIETRTQGVAQKILDEVGRTISTTAVEISGRLTKDGSNWEAYCIAGIKYSFLEYGQLDREVTGKERVFIKSIVTDEQGRPTGNCADSGSDPDPPERGCSNPAKTTEAACGVADWDHDSDPMTPLIAGVWSAGGVELLGRRMMLEHFSIRTFGRLHVIQLNLVYGGDPDNNALQMEVFDFSNEVDPADADTYLRFRLNRADRARCELGETFCFITINRREIYQSVSE